MSPQPALPFSPTDLARLRARHQADQQEAWHASARARRRDLTALLLAHALLVVFVVAGCYAVAAAAGLVPALPGSAVAGG